MRCDELCGIWHGAVYDTGKVMSMRGFMNWAGSNEWWQRRRSFCPVRLDLHARRQPGPTDDYYPDSNDHPGNVEVYGAQGQAVGTSPPMEASPVTGPDG